MGRILGENSYPLPVVVKFLVDSPWLGKGLQKAGNAIDELKIRIAGKPGWGGTRPVGEPLQSDPELPVVGALLQRRFVLLPALLPIRLCQMEMSPGQMSVKGTREFRLKPRVKVGRQARITPAQVIVEIGSVLSFGESFEVTRSIAMLRFSKIQVTQQQKNLRVSRLGFLRLLQVSRGLPITPLLKYDGSQVEVHARQFGLERKGLPEGGFRFFPMPQVKMDQAEIGL